MSPETLVTGQVAHHSQPHWARLEACLQAKLLRTHAAQQQAAPQGTSQPSSNVDVLGTSAAQQASTALGIDAPAGGNRNQSTPLAALPPSAAPGTSLAPLAHQMLVNNWAIPALPRGMLRPNPMAASFMLSGSNIPQPWLPQGIPWASQPHAHGGSHASPSSYGIAPGMHNAPLGTTTSAQPGAPPPFAPQGTRAGPTLRAGAPTWSAGLRAGASSGAAAPAPPSAVGTSVVGVGASPSATPAKRPRYDSNMAQAAGNSPEAAPANPGTGTGTNTGTGTHTAQGGGGGNGSGPTHNGDGSGSGPGTGGTSGVGAGPRQHRRSAHADAGRACAGGCATASFKHRWRPGARAVPSAHGSRQRRRRRFVASVAIHRPRRGGASERRRAAPDFPSASDPAALSGHSCGHAQPGHASARCACQLTCACAVCLQTPCQHRSCPAWPQANLPATDALLSNSFGSIDLICKPALTLHLEMWFVQAADNEDNHDWAAVQDTTSCGLGSYTMRALVADHACGRLAFYEALANLAASHDWNAFIICVLEYVDASGFDTKALFRMHSEDS